MRWFAQTLLAANTLFCLAVITPPFGSFRPVPALLALLAAIGFAGTLGSIAARWPQKSWAPLMGLGLAASTLLAFLSAGRFMILPLSVNIILTWGLLRGHWSETTRASLPDASRPVHPLLYVPVPWVFVAGYLAGVLLQQLMPVTIHEQRTRFIVWLIGLVLVVAGSVLAGWGLITFRRARTTTVPLEKSGTIVTWGPYAFSRNPMYVGLTLIYLGEMAIFAQLWPLVLIVPTLAYVNGIVIPFEEAQLRAAFGRRYDDYAARVRRWL
jgi:protein-S-isoprenylcysteine O-methyltransferase Ste14